MDVFSFVARNCCHGPGLVACHLDKTESCEDGESETEEVEVIKDQDANPSRENPKLPQESGEAHKTSPGKPKSDPQRCWMHDFVTMLRSWGRLELSREAKLDIVKTCYFI